MSKNKANELSQEDYIRYKLFAEDKSSWKRYAEVVIGNDSLWKLIKYELITTFLGPIPGALGLMLRKWFYPMLIKKCGPGVVFGRNVVIRNGQNISLGEKVMIDDDSLLDGRGAGEQGLVVGNQVVLNRSVSVQCKVGPVNIGCGTDIGAGSSIISQGGITIGAMVSTGGSCKIGGGVSPLDSGNTEASLAGSSDPEHRDYRRFSRGEIQIGDRCTLGWGAMVMDAVRIGSGSLIGAGVILRRDVSPESVVLPQDKLIAIPREQFGSHSVKRAKPHSVAEATPRRVAPIEQHNEDTILAAVYQAIDELNQQLPEPRRLHKSPRTALLEPSGPLDSMGLVNLVVVTEQILKDELGFNVSLTELSDEYQGTSPYQDVQSFAAFIQSALRQAA